MPVESLDLVVAERMWRVNVNAPMELVQLLLPLLRRSDNPSIINVTSIHDRVPYAQNSVYCATKSALAMFTRTAALELASSRVRVNNLAPGAVETDINREVLDRIGRERFGPWMPMGRIGSVEDLVEPALFLASSVSGYMTGATLLVDGGYSGHLVRYRPMAEEGR